MTTQQLDYQSIEERNKAQFMEIMRQTMPELHILAVQMEKTRANPAVLFYVIRHMAEIANGTGYGQVHVLIEEGLARFVKGEHSTKLNEPIIKPDTQ